MPTLKQKIEAALKEAAKNKETLRLSVLRMLVSAAHNRSIDKRTKLSKKPDVKDLEKESELTEEELLEVIKSEAKKRREAVVEFGKGGRQDLVEKESAELKILGEYLPPELPDEEIEKAIKEVIAKAGAPTAKDFGRIMGETMKRLKGQASGEKVGEMVRKLLS